MKLTGLFIYPIKSISGISLSEALCGERGLQYDRRWMLIDENNRFLSQRQLPAMAMMDIHINSNQMVVSHREKPSDILKLPLILAEGEMLDVEVWEDSTKALWQQSTADTWFTEALNIKCRLVYMPKDAIRRVDPKYVKIPVNTSFSDGYPYLLTNESSLNDLSERADVSIEMERFRPNLVISGNHPFEEDHWKTIQVGKVIFHLVKPCARCVLTTINPQTSEAGKEPLKTLSTYRKDGHKILFGQNMIVEKYGIIRIGDEISILE